MADRAAPPLSFNVSDVKRWGLFDTPWGQDLWVRLGAGVRLSVARVQEQDAMVVRWRCNGAQHERRIRFIRKPLRRGCRLYFLCPVTGDPVDRLYLEGDALASRQALGLDYPSRTPEGRAYAKSEAYAADKRRAALSRARHLRRLKQKRTAVQAVRRPNGPTITPLMGRGREVLSAYARDAAAAGAPIRLVAETAITSWGLAAEHPQIDLWELQRADYLWTGEIHLAKLSWLHLESGAPQMWIALDLRDAMRPTALLVNAPSDAPATVQSLQLQRCKGRWLFCCPMTGHRVRYLYGRAGRFACLQAQGLTRLDREPISPFRPRPVASTSPAWHYDSRNAARWVSHTLDSSDSSSALTDR